MKRLSQEEVVAQLKKAIDETYDKFTLCRWFNEICPVEGKILEVPDPKSNDRRELNRLYSPKPFQFSWK